MGHCHPKVNQALKDQVDKLWHTTSIYMYPKVIYLFAIKCFSNKKLYLVQIHEYAERLTATLPEKLNTVLFVNSGSEANDMAMYMARMYTGNYDLLSFRNAYHGN